jgi:aerobic C4-dicarboxylate transport protein
MLELYAPMFIMFAIVAVICTVMFAGGHFVGPKNPTPEKVMPFECGNDTPGARDVKMNVKFYLTAILFVVVILGTVARLTGFSIFKLIKYLKAELLLVLGTSSSEAALPNLIQKMEAAGCEKSVVGLVVPTGYSFNLDGTNIYMTLAALFIAQATNTHLTLGQELLLLVVAMISSKGAAGVTGAGFITLAATLSIVPTVPIAGMALILGVDRFMSECRSLTNFIGNAVATIVVARWEGALDRDKLDAALSGKLPDFVPAPIAAVPAH